MKSYILNIIILLATLIGVEGKSQERMSLNDCIHYALENNLNLNKYAIEKKIAKKEHIQSYRNLMPSVTASTTAEFDFGRSIDANTNEYVNVNAFANSYNASASVILFNGFQQKNAIQLQKYLLKKAGNEEKKATDDLVFEIMQAFFNVVYYTEMTEIAQEQVNTTELQLNIMERRANLGLNAKSDLLEIQANLQTEELNLLQMENRTELDLMKLKELLNYDIEDTLLIHLEMAQFAQPMPTLQLDTFNNKAIYTPRIQVAELNLQATKKQLDIKKGKLSPVISGYGGSWEWLLHNNQQHCPPILQHTNKQQIKRVCGAIGLAAHMEQRGALYRGVHC